ncbi:CPCC family cysteine-rich protein [Pseudomonas sp. TWP3-2]|uniref:CPCC family cysteine-rich protein n=1 Tax=Pseudomonas sp. TWP3-2 TaxID=2804574 RepID=UPI003CEE2C59
MSTLDRHQAINKISTEILTSLDHDERESILLDWWGIDESNPEFFALSDDMRSTIKACDDLPSDIDEKKYDELLRIALNSNLKGVTNTYLAEKLSSLNLGEYNVYGQVELLESCPCCGYLTLSSHGSYDICDLCQWEDDCTLSLDTYSGPNHMTLGEAKKNFLKIGQELQLGKWVKRED